MKRILNALKFALAVYKAPQAFQPPMLDLLVGQFNFLKEDSDSNSPRVANLAHIYWEDTEQKEVKLLNVWCGVGENTPFERLRELAEENRKLKIRVAELINKIPQ